MVTSDGLCFRDGWNMEKVVSVGVVSMMALVFGSTWKMHGPVELFQVLEKCSLSRSTTQIAGYARLG